MPQKMCLPPVPVKLGGCWEVLGIDQPKVSALLRGRLEGFSSDRLFRFLNALDRDIEIVIKPARKGRRHPPGIRVFAVA